MKGLSMTVAKALDEFRMMGYSNDSLLKNLEQIAGNALVGVNVGEEVVAGRKWTRIDFQLNADSECDWIWNQALIRNCFDFKIESFSNNSGLVRL